MNKLIMYPHGGSGNHGCEAIVRSTIDIMNEVFSNNIDETILFSTRAHEDIKAGLESKCKIMNELESSVPKTEYLNFNKISTFVAN